MIFVLKLTNLLTGIGRMIHFTIGGLGSVAGAIRATPILVKFLDNLLQKALGRTFPNGFVSNLNVFVAHCRLIDNVKKEATFTLFDKN